MRVGDQRLNGGVWRSALYWNRFSGRMCAEMHSFLVLVVENVVSYVSGCADGVWYFCAYLIQNVEHPRMQHVHADKATKRHSHCVSFRFTTTRGFYKYRTTNVAHRASRTWQNSMWTRALLNHVSWLNSSCQTNKTINRFSDGDIIIISSHTER